MYVLLLLLLLSIYKNSIYIYIYICVCERSSYSIRSIDMSEAKLDGISIVDGTAHHVPIQSNPIQSNPIQSNLT